MTSVEFRFTLLISVTFIGLVWFCLYFCPTPVLLMVELASGISLVLDFLLVLPCCLVSVSVLFWSCLCLSPTPVLLLLELTSCSCLCFRLVLLEILSDNSFLVMVTINSFSLTVIQLY